VSSEVKAFGCKVKVLGFKAQKVAPRPRPKITGY